MYTKFRSIWCMEKLQKRNFVVYKSFIMFTYLSSFIFRLQLLVTLETLDLYHSVFFPKQLSLHYGYNISKTVKVSQNDGIIKASSLNHQRRQLVNKRFYFKFYTTEDKEKQIHTLINSCTAYVGHVNKVSNKINDLIENCKHKKIDCLQDQLMSLSERIKGIHNQIDT